MIVYQPKGELLDPDGVMAYNEPYAAPNQYLTPKQLQGVFASHAA